MRRRSAVPFLELEMNRNATMNRLMLSVACLLLSVIANPLRGEETAPPQVAALKASGIAVSSAKGGGFNVDIRDAKVLTEESWARLESLGGIRKISVGAGHEFTDATLASMAGLQTLEEIFINGSAITDEGLAALARLPKLAHFGMHHGPGALTGKGLVALKAHAHFRSVEFGGMSGIDDRTAAFLAQLPQLRVVKLFHTRNTRASLPQLAALPLLESFCLNPHFEPTRITAADIALLAPAKQLRELDLSDMVLPFEDGLAHLKALPALKKVSLEWSYYTDEDLAKLRAALPGLEIKTGNRAGEDKLNEWNKRLRESGKKLPPAAGAGVPMHGLRP